MKYRKMLLFKESVEGIRMRVLYVAPRYHTNQIPVIKGWLENGHQVKFVSQFAGTPEDYSLLRPDIMGYSGIFEFIIKIYCFLFCRNQKNDTKEYAFRVKCGFPPFRKPEQILREFAPDLVIVRERSCYNIPFYRYCKKKGIKCILYNQSPLWDIPGKEQSILKKAFLHFLPRQRMTPVLGNRERGKEITPNATYVPFIIDPHFSAEEKGHFLNNCIQILCVGRYEERKNLFLLLDALQDLFVPFHVHLTIIGEMTDQGQKEYFGKLKKLIEERNLTEYITLLTNIQMEQMYEEYRKADLFVLPSTRERASISQLEAMSCSLPVICSDTNGSACYIENGKNGYLFQDNDVKDLHDKVRTCVESKEKLITMGKNSFEAIKNQYQFKNYYHGVMSIYESFDYHSGI